MYGFFDEVPYEPIAWPEADADHPGLRVRNTYWVFSVLGALDDLRARVEDGDDLFPPDAVTILEARSRATDAVANLGRSGSPLQRWMAWRLVPGFDGPDEAVDSVAGSDRPEIADAYGEYVWIQMVARAATETTSMVAAALDG